MVPARQSDQEAMPYQFSGSRRLKFKKVRYIGTNLTDTDNASRKPGDNDI